MKIFHFVHEIVSQRVQVANSYLAIVKNKEVAQFYIIELSQTHSQTLMEDN